MGTTPRLDSRCGQEVRDHPQYVRITLRGVVESRCIDERHSPSIEGEFICELNLVCAGLQARSNLQVRGTGEIDELDASIEFPHAAEELFKPYRCLSAPGCTHNSVRAVRPTSRSLDWGPAHTIMMGAPDAGQRSSDVSYICEGVGT